MTAPALIPLSSLANGAVVQSNNAPASGATAFVYLHGTQTQVTVLSAETGGATLAQPIQADANGVLPGWVAAGQDLDIVATFQGRTASAALAEPQIASTVVTAKPVSAGYGHYDVDSNDNIAIGSTLASIQPGFPTGAHANVSYGSGTRSPLPVGNLNLLTTGYDNTAIGAGVLVSATTGHSNTGVGSDTLGALTTATGNTAVGAQAAETLTTGSNNTAIGVGALQNATTAASNTAVGVSAGTSITTGTNSVLVGNNAGSAIQTGTATVIGANAVNVNLTAPSGVTVVGNGAGQLLNNSAVNIVAVGDSALANATVGSLNTVIGSGAGSAVTTAGSITLVGYAAGLGLTTGNSATFIGRQAGQSIITGAGVTVVGDNAGHTSTTDHNYMTLIGANTAGSADGVVAIGIDHTGAAAAATVQDTFVLGTSAHAVQVPGTLAVTGSIGFFGHALAARPAAYTLNAGAVSRNLASGATLVNVEQVLREVITDLQGYGLLQ